MQRYKFFLILPNISLFIFFILTLFNKSSIFAAYITYYINNALLYLSAYLACTYNTSTLSSLLYLPILPMRFFLAIGLNSEGI